MACFSEGQLAKMAGKKRISQDTFDAAVRENIEEFEMEPEEAVASAVQEFEAQGVDLSNIIKTASGGDIGSHPAALAVKSLETAAAAGARESGQALAGMGLASLGQLLEEAGPAEQGALLAVLLKAEAVWALVRCLTAWPEAEAVVLPTLRLLPRLLGASREHQGAFRQAGGVAAVQGVMEKHEGSTEVLAAALSALAAAGVRSEDGKAVLMDGGLGTRALQLLERGGDSPELVQGACALLCTLTNPDDDTQPSSRAFPNARALGKEGAAAVLVGALRQGREAGQPPEATAALCTALKQVSANEEICQEVAAAGGVALALDVLRSGMSQPAIARPALSLLRQLASSDGNKALVVEGGGLGLVSEVLAAHPANYALAEQALGLLTNVTLRNPEAAVQAVEGGCAGRVLDAMNAWLAAAEGTSGVQQALRQACMALRNIAARSPEVRPALLERGAERVLRGVKARYLPGPGGEAPPVRDAASAALRDLGLDNYND